MPTSRVRPESAKRDIDMPALDTRVPGAGEFLRSDRRMSASRRRIQHVAPANVERPVRPSIHA